MIISRLPQGGGGKKSLILADNVYSISVSSYDNRLVVNWAKPLNSEAVIKEYNFYWVASDTKPASLEQFTNKVTLNSSTVSQTLTGLTANQRYWIAIESVNEDGYENASLRNIVSEKASVPYFMTFQRASNGLTMKNGYGSTDGKTWTNLGESTNPFGGYMPQGCIYYTSDDCFTMIGGSSNYNGVYSVEFKKGTVSFLRSIKLSDITTVYGYVNASGKTVIAHKNVIYYKKDGATSYVTAPGPASVTNINPDYLSYCNGYYFYSYQSSALNNVNLFQNWRSTDCITWEFIGQTTGRAIAEAKSNTTDYAPSQIIYFNGKYLTPMHYSIDGKTWIYRHPGSGNIFTGIFVFKDKVYAHRYSFTNGGMYVSDDGINFTQKSLVSNAGINSMCIGPSKNGVLTFIDPSTMKLGYTLDLDTLVLSSINYAGTVIGVNTTII